MAEQLKAVLRISGPEVPQDTIEVTSKGLKVGRLAANDLTLKHQKLSRFHAEFHISDGGLTVVDLGSSNGTQVGDTQIDPEKPHILNVGDVVRLGPFTLTVEEISAPPPLEQTVQVEAPSKGDVPEPPMVTMAVSSKEVEKAVKAEAKEVEDAKKADEKKSKEAEASKATVQGEVPVEEDDDSKPSDAATIKPRQEMLDEAAEAPTPPPEPTFVPEKKPAAVEVEAEEPPSAPPKPVSEDVTIVPKKTDPPIVQYEDELPPVEPLMPEPDEEILTQSFVPTGKPEKFKPPEPPELPPRVPLSASSNGHMPEHLEGLPRDQSMWLEYLPPIYAEDEFTPRFLLIFESIQAPIEWLLDHFYMNFTATYAPPEWLQWFGRWADILVPAEIEEAKQRAIIAELGPLFLTRGTPNSLSRHLELVFDKKLDIKEPKNKPSTFEVVLSLGKSGNTEQNQKIATRIIESHRPAHTAYTLTIK